MEVDGAAAALGAVAVVASDVAAFGAVGALEVFLAGAADFEVADFDVVDALVAFFTGAAAFEVVVDDPLADFLAGAVDFEVAEDGALVVFLAGALELAAVLAFFAADFFAVVFALEVLAEDDDLAADFDAEAFLVDGAVAVLLAALFFAVLFCTELLEAEPVGVLLEALFLTAVFLTAVFAAGEPLAAAVVDAVDFLVADAEVLLVAFFATRLVGVRVLLAVALFFVADGVFEAATLVGTVFDAVALGEDAELVVETAFFAVAFFTGVAFLTAASLVGFAFVAAVFFVGAAFFTAARATFLVPGATGRTTTSRGSDPTSSWEARPGRAPAT